MIRKTVRGVVTLPISLFLFMGIASGNGAVVVTKGSCGVLDTNCIGNVPGTGTFVTTPSGNIIGTCHAQVTDPPDRVQNCNFGNTGIQCNDGGTPTADWQEIISPGGQATIICHVR
jgi:hypothetical protein